MRFCAMRKPEFRSCNRLACGTAEGRRCEPVAMNFAGKAGATYRLVMRTAVWCSRVLDQRSDLRTGLTSTRIASLSDGLVSLDKKYCLL